MIISARKDLKIDLNDYELPIFSSDIENAEGIPEAAMRFKECIRSVDGIIISLAEHNGNFTAAFKNLSDWVSRIQDVIYEKERVWSKKNMFLMSTSPGGRGGQTVFEMASGLFPRQDANITASFSLPFFNENFTSEGISDAELAKSLAEQIQLFSASLEAE